MDVTSLTAAAVTECYKAREKHTAFPDLAAVGVELANRITKFTAAVGSVADHDYKDQVYHRLLQIAAVALMGIDEIALTPAAPKPDLAPEQ